MKETENTRSWEETKAVAKRLMMEQSMQHSKSEHDLSVEDLGVIRLSVYAPLPVDIQAESLADRLEASVRRRIDKIPDSELRLMDEAIEFLRSFPLDRKRFVGRLATGYERQREYWKSLAIDLSDVVGDGGTDSEWMINKLMESYGHKG